MIGNNTNKKSGFTLIEILVAISIFAVIILAVSSIFRNVITNQRTTSDDSATREDIKYFVEIFSREVKGAVRNSTAADVCGVAPDHMFASNASSTELYFQNQKGQCVAYFTALDDNGVNRLEIARDSEAFFISSGAINIAAINFTMDDSAAVQPIVTVNVQVLSQADQTIPAYNIQTTISPREIYVAPVATTTPTTTQAFAPSDLASLDLWLKADAGVVTTTGDYVTAWNNQGASTGVTQSDGPSRPVLVQSVLNGKPVIRFNGSSYLDGGTTEHQIGANGETVFIVDKTNTTGMLVGKFLYGGSGIRWWINYWGGVLYSNYNGDTSHGVNRASGSFEQLSVIWNRTDLSNNLYANGANIGSWSLSSGDPTNGYNFLIGAGANAGGSLPPVTETYLNGDIAEIIIYNRPLSDTERQQVESYLNTKYSIY
ncbi:MAG: prepilin-type N-terminal cleavage/methylation domain-containing protein [Candidatus Falkowbacteria bacterium]